MRRLRVGVGRGVLLQLLQLVELVLHLTKHEVDTVAPQKRDVLLDAPPFRFGRLALPLGPRGYTAALGLLQHHEGNVTSMQRSMQRSM